MDRLTENILMLNTAIGPNNTLIEKIEDYFGEEGLGNLMDLMDELKEANILDKEKYDSVERFIREDRIEFYDEYFQKENIRIVTKFDDAYPDRLRYIDNQPYIIYVKGNLEKLNSSKMGISIVGSRKATSYGKWVAESIAGDLAEKGVSIISGMAFGIDSIAHGITLGRGGFTAAVLGSGIDVIYPAKNKKLYHEIEEKGCIISEFAPGTPPIGFNFPLRNRIISGLGDGVLVVEAGIKSGSLITATYGAEQGKVVFAVPGNIDSIYSKGVNKLIRDGARIVTSAGDIFEDLSYDAYENKSFETDLGNYDEIKMALLGILGSGEKSIAEIEAKLDYDMNKILSNLTVLEMDGLIIQSSGKKFRLINNEIIKYMETVLRGGNDG
ncbi:DNA processing protein [Dethiosulfatibacter aminovorans DSM 17477]|uniref:DNA processing protein n=1 Tax=Dethiosulfatibacter aminovorans DSM 17477 TaxID=1121476 RepID=A0A1M6DF16_9FIRM|nr:DNA-processing protein DprA [Dethiosulfatibacter aminovorans]SHI71780.1 DNA processing protein [Dethiosulfatibacter aminovorans DSM 17477]